MTKIQKKTGGVMGGVALAAFIVLMGGFLFWKCGGKGSSFPVVTSSIIDSMATNVARAHYIAQHQPTDKRVRFDSSYVYYTVDNRTGDTTDLNVSLYFKILPDSTLEVAYFLQPHTYNYKDHLEFRRPKEKEPK